MATVTSVPGTASSRSTSAWAAATPSVGQKLPLVTTPVAEPCWSRRRTAAPSRAARGPANTSPTRTCGASAARRARSGAAPGVDYTAFAAQKLRELYWGAALKYPRVKNINWLNIDMQTSAFVQPRAPERRNDYSLPGVPAKVAAFRDLLGVQTFRTAFSTGTVHVPQPFPARMQLREAVQGAVWLRTFEPPTRVTVTLDGRAVPVGAALPYRFTLPADLSPGRHTLTVTASGSGGKTLVSRVQTFDVQP